MKILEEELGLQNRGDLLYYFPRRWLDRSLAESTLLRTGEVLTLVVRVSNSYLAHGRKTRLLVHCRTLNGEALTLVFFRSPQFFRGIFKPDSVFVVSGKLDYYQGLQMAHPEYESLEEEDDKLIHVGRIVPLYPSGDALKKKGMDSRGFRRLIAAIFDDPGLDVPELLPAKVLGKRKLHDRLTALRGIHFPEDEAALDESKRRLRYEELFLFHSLMHHKRLKRETIPREIFPLPCGQSPSYQKLLEDLPFQLTGEQDRAIQEMLEQGLKNHAESCLLQGDVGSGKTITALAVALHYIDAGAQVALMAPTEVLARQHFRVMSDLLGLGGAARTELLTGQGGKKARAQALDRILRGEGNLVIGTHSLIEEDVEFSNLGLVIIDEQHRFGVEQRDALRRKGKNPDLIVMTATPIPRTLSLTGFADLRLVTLKEKPAGRKPIKTMRLTENRRPGLYKSIANHVSEGRQCYIVFPVIEESEKLDLRAATDAFEELKTAVFPQFRLELLHGRLKAKDKERVMNEFREGRVQILVTTTVIEVGVDVANATIMVVEHAERFGISQLHQLRGRVGRGSEDSFCVLMSSAEAGEDADRRLKALEDSDDGFYLAEVDMEIRGPGQLLGLKQHGLTGFRLADLRRDKKLAEQAYEDVREYPELNDAALEQIRRQFPEGIVVFPG